MNALYSSGVDTHNSYADHIREMNSTIQGFNNELAGQIDQLKGEQDEEKTMAGGISMLKGSTAMNSVRGGLKNLKEAKKLAAEGAARAEQYYQDGKAGIGVRSIAKAATETELAELPSYLNVAARKEGTRRAIEEGRQVEAAAVRKHGSVMNAAREIEAGRPLWTAEEQKLVDAGRADEIYTEGRSVQDLSPAEYEASQARRAGIDEVKASILEAKEGAAAEGVDLAGKPLRQSFAKETARTPQPEPEPEPEPSFEPEPEPEPLAVEEAEGGVDRLSTEMTAAEAEAIEGLETMPKFTGGGFVGRDAVEAANYTKAESLGSRIQTAITGEGEVARTARRAQEADFAARDARIAAESKAYYDTTGRAEQAALRAGDDAALGIPEALALNAPAAAEETSVLARAGELGRDAYSTAKDALLPAGEITELGIDRGLRVGGGVISGGLGIYKDIKQGGLGDNWLSRVGNVANIAGSGLEVVGALGMEIPVFGAATEIAGALIAGAGAGLEAIGDSDDADTKGAAEVSQLKSQAQSLAAPSSTTVAVGRSY